MTNDPEIRYRIATPDPTDHRFIVELEIDRPDPDGQILRLPAWIPGSYMIRDFARNVLRVSASGHDTIVEIRKLDKDTWQCAPCVGALHIRYEVHALDLSVRSAWLDQQRGYFNGTALCLRVLGRDDKPCAVHIARSDHPATSDWEVATSLPPERTDERGFGDYLAGNYEDLIDHPVEIAPITWVRFEAHGIPHAMALSGTFALDSERLARDLTRICTTHIELFGAPPPIDRYLFLTLVVGDAYGGLEHRFSSSLICTREDLPRPGMGAATEEYQRFLGLCSHEYFHLWNVKRIRPAILQAADLSREAHTELLWFFEGVTSYYDDLALLRSGVIALTDYLRLIAQTATRVQRGPGRELQSIAESSFDAWTRFYKQDANAPNAIVSYYAKGSLVALGLDMTLRRRSNERLSLDHLMRALWQRHGQRDLGLAEDTVQRLAEELLGQTLNDFFDAYVHGTVQLPLDEWLPGLGVDTAWQPARNEEDKGACAIPAELADIPHTIGITSKPNGTELEVLTVMHGGPAQRAGVSPGDRLVAVNGIRASGKHMAQCVVDAALANAGVDIALFRRDELMTLHVQPVPAPADTCYLWARPEQDLDTATATRRTSWIAPQRPVKTDE